MIAIIFLNILKIKSKNFILLIFLHRYFFVFVILGHVIDYNSSNKSYIHFNLHTLLPILEPINFEHHLNFITLKRC